MRGQLLTKVSDYFAELYVAGRFAEAGWNVYFPRRDRGFDFIVSKSASNGSQLIRPVQVKGKYPTPTKRDLTSYGFVGELSERHPEMVLAIPFFTPESRELPTCVAYMPPSLIKPHTRGVRCEPATLTASTAKPRREFVKFFNDAGLRLVEQPDWCRLVITRRE